MANGNLYLVSVPIGNIKDITLRALEILKDADAIIAEDTRQAGDLIKLLNLPRVRLLSYRDQQHERVFPQILELLSAGKNLALISDRGTPTISDPGYKLVRECLKQQIKVTVVPGPSALINALTVSGLPPNQFLFLGYLPAKSGLRIKLLTDLKNTFNHSELKPTVIFYESPHRLNRTLTDIKIIFGDIKVVIARELTKVYEEIFSENISEILKAGKNLKGEITLLFEIK